MQDFCICWVADPVYYAPEAAFPERIGTGPRSGSDTKLGSVKFSVFSVSVFMFLPFNEF